MGYRNQPDTFSWIFQPVTCCFVILLLTVIPWYYSQWQLTHHVYSEEKLEPEELKLIELYGSVYEAHRITRSSFTKLILRESLNILNEILPNSSYRVLQSRYGNKRDGAINFTGSQQSKCKAASLDRLVEVLLHANTCNQGLRLIRNLRQFYPQLFVRISISGFCNISLPIYNIPRVQWHFHLTDGAYVWVRLAEQAQTKYVLVGRNLIQMSRHTDLDRLVRLILCKGLADVVGGAVRHEPLGRWDFGCYQTSIRNFTLRILPGYEQAVYSCAYCDYITSPFIIERGLLQRALSRSSLRGFVSVMDLFLQLVHSGLDVVQTPKIVSCIDVLFHVTNPMNAQGHCGIEAIPEPDWLMLARKWLLTDIVLPGGIQHKWSCSLIGLSCNDFLETDLLIPPCCLRERNHCVQGFLTLAHTQHVSTRIHGNNLVGIVYPFQEEQPWQLEQDFVWDLSNFTVLYEKVRPQLYKDYGCKMFAPCDQPEYCSHLILGSSNWNTTIRGEYIPFKLERRKNRSATLISVNGLWAPTYFNPGLISAYSSVMSLAYTSSEMEEHYWVRGTELAPFPYCFGKYLRSNCLSGNYLPLGNLQFHEIDT